MKLFDEVKENIVENLDNFYNPSSSYSKAQTLSALMNETRVTIATELNANPNNVIFTSGATEANNLALFGYKNVKTSSYNIAHLGFDHASVNAALKFLKKSDHNIIKLKYKDIINNLDETIKVLKENNVSFLALSHIYPNIGIKIPIDKISKRIKEEIPRIYIHVDVAQSFMKEEIKMGNIDSLSITAHKIGGLKGVGALILRDKNIISPVIMGGKQNFSLRAGTQNVIGILSFKKAIEAWINNRQEFQSSLSNLNSYFREQFDLSFNDEDYVKIISPTENNICNNIVVIAVKNVLSEHIIRFLDENDIYISAASTCGNPSFKPPFLSAISLEPEFHGGIIRVSFAPYSEKREIDLFLVKFKEAILYFF